MAPELLEGDVVYWDPKKTNIPAGKGIIRGIATNDLPFVGYTYIIEIGESLVNETYPYTCCVMFQCFLSRNENNFKEVAAKEVA
jgi:hypothetical protein